LGVSKGIIGKESGFKFSGVKSSITGAIVSCNEKINFFRSSINTNGIKSTVEFSRRNSSASVGIEDIESISEVEVWFSGKINLGLFKILFIGAEIFKGMDELILIVWSKSWTWGWVSNWLSNWRSLCS